MTNKVIVSGNNVTVKRTNSIAKILSDVHPKQPEKGTKNPVHVQVNIWKFWQQAKIKRIENEE